MDRSLYITCRYIFLKLVDTVLHGLLTLNTALIYFVRVDVSFTDTSYIFTDQVLRRADSMPYLSVQVLTFSAIKMKVGRAPHTKYTESRYAATYSSRNVHILV